MREQRVRIQWGTLVAVFVFGLALSVSAQEPLSVAAGKAAAGAPGAPVRALTLDDAVQLALENNLGLQVQRINPELQDTSISAAKAAWMPTLGGSVSISKRNSPVNSFFSGADDVLSRDTLTSTVTASQALPMGGGNYSVTWDTNRNESNSVFDSPNPSLGANVRFEFTQPLVRNFKVDGSRQNLLVSKANRDISDIDLRQTTLATIRSVKYAYWNLKGTQSALQVAQQSLGLARELLKNNRTQVEVGTKAPIDVVEAEAEVARREEAVIVAEGELARAGDNLRTLIFKPDTDNYWGVVLEPVDKAVLERRPVDPDEAVKVALEKRTDLKAARKNLEVTNSNVTYYRNQTLPDVSAVLSYGQTGQGGTKKNFGDGFPPPIIGQIEEGWGTVISRMVKPDYNNWSIGIQVSYPLGTSSADANTARARLQVKQQQLQLQDLELQVAASVRDVARAVETNWKRYEATSASKRLAERRLEAEQKKFAAGLSTNYLVFQAQRDLADAQYSELSSALAYNKSLVDFETVQEAPTAGSAGVSFASVNTGSAQR